MQFGEVIQGLKQGKRFRREETMDVDQFIFLVPGSIFVVNREPLLGILGAGVEVQYRPHIDLRGDDGSIGKWTPDDEDLLADDWVEVESDENDEDEYAETVSVDGVD